MSNQYELPIWPLEQVGEALEALARHIGVAPHSSHIPEPGALSDLAALGNWLESVAGLHGLELERCSTTYSALAEVLYTAAPAVISLSGEVTGLLVVLDRRGDSVIALGSDGRRHKIAINTLCTLMSAALERPWNDEITALLEHAAIASSRRSHARRVLLRERLSDQPIMIGWIVRLPPEAAFGQQLRAGRWLGLLGLAVAAYAAAYSVVVAAWWILGLIVFQSTAQSGLIEAWVLALLTSVPLVIASLWAQGRLAIGMGALLRRRILAGALRLEGEETRHQGIGQLLGRVNESDAVETLAINGGLAGILALIELVIGGIIISAGAAAGLHVGLLVMWSAVTAALAFSYTRSLRAWVHARVTATHTLIERMVGYRTLLVQESRGQRHRDEDRALRNYLALGHRADQRGTLLLTLLPGGWMIAAIAALAPAISAGASPQSVAISVGGILTIYQAFQRLAPGIWNLTAAISAWEQVVPLFNAATRPRTLGRPGAAANAPAPVGTVVCEARRLRYHYAGRGEAVLNDCSLQIRSGDRLLLEGPSGGGKSTLASLLVGLRRPHSGLLLQRGLDWTTLGEAAWRRRAVAAPQFHENHVFSETFAFNVLMGRAWPPEPDDVARAYAICHALGLGDLLERMPAGMLQMVGETGWQLSHGERSRLYIARALLQGADLVILDESFAALDPKTMQMAVDCVLNEAPALVVIAHP